MFTSTLITCREEIEMKEIQPESRSFQVKIISCQFKPQVLLWIELERKNVFCKTNTDHRYQEAGQSLASPRALSSCGTIHTFGSCCQRMIHLVTTRGPFPSAILHIKFCMLSNIHWNVIFVGAASDQAAIQPCIMNVRIRTCAATLSNVIWSNHRLAASQ